jgi:hypothetical protein
MNPELKEKIDRIQSLNVSKEQKMALFGRLMEGEKAKYPPAPQRQPGLMEQPQQQMQPQQQPQQQMQPRIGMPANMNQGFNVAELNAARQGLPNPSSQTMAFYAKPNIANVIKNSTSVDPYNRGKTNPSRNLPFDQSTNDRFLRGKEDYLKQQQMLSQMQPVENVGEQTANPADDPYRGQLRQEGVGPIDEYSGASLLNQTGGAEGDPDGTFDPPQAPPSMFDNIKEYMFAGKDQQGLFGGTGVDPKTGENRGSMGLGGAFGRLFNNPNRMAMLSGGLTAMDPGSYYDKEGFSSPWTGLRSGLGGAQAGYKSVIDRRKAEADTALAKAKTRSEGLPPEDKISVTSTNTDVITVNKTLANKLKRKYMKPKSLGGLGLSEPEAYRKAVSEVTARAADKGMRSKEAGSLFEQWNTGEVTLKKIQDAKKLVRPDTMSLLAKVKRGFDTGLTIAQITHNPSDATQLKQIMDELAYPMMQSIMGIPLTSKLIDSEAERDLIKDLSQNPVKYGNPVMLMQKLNVIEGLYKKLQKDRKIKLGGRAYDSPSGGTRKPLVGGGDPVDFINALTPTQ